MFQKLLPIQILCFAACIGIAIGAFVFMKARPIKTNYDLKDAKPKMEFNEAYCNTMITDTFSKLVLSAYPSFATVTKRNNVLHVSIKGAGALTQDFYNGNDNLLKYSLDDFGFDIKYLKESKSIEADFKLLQNGVTVPNDVLLRLAAKTYQKPVSQPSTK
jgi:isocitrate dehydrogenase kinase/phosphatase